MRGGACDTGQEWSLDRDCDAMFGLTLSVLSGFLVHCAQGQLTLAALYR